MMISEFAEHNKDKYNIGGVIIGDYRNEKHSNFYLQFTEEEKNASSILEAYEILDLSRNIEIIKKGRSWQLKVRMAMRFFSYFVVP